MIAPSPATQPFGAAALHKARQIMDVILHIGAHRCATTSFQHYMRRNRSGLSRAGVEFWGPGRTRGGLFDGLFPRASDPGGMRSCHQTRIGVQTRCAHGRATGARALVVSEENMLGTMRMNLRLSGLYCGAGERVARFGEAFSGYLTDVVLNIRSLDTYWTSVVGFTATRGLGVAGSAHLARLAGAPRSWRDVITDVAQAVPQARLHVLPFERFAGRPDAQLGHIAGMAAPRAAAGAWHNAAPHLPRLRRIVPARDGALPEGRGRWMPFTDGQCAELREKYADDMLWLAGGADGLARLAAEPAHNRAEQHPPHPDMIRGSNDESRHRDVARAGREGIARQAG